MNEFLNAVFLGLKDVFFAAVIILIISFTSCLSLDNSDLFLERSVSSIISNQYSVSSASSTTIHILLKNSAFDLAQHAAR